MLKGIKFCHLELHFCFTSVLTLCSYTSFVAALPCPFLGLYEVYYCLISLVSWLPLLTHPSLYVGVMLIMHQKSISPAAFIDDSGHLHVEKKSILSLYSAASLCFVGVWAEMVLFVFLRCTLSSVVSLFQSHT